MGIDPKSFKSLGYFSIEAHDFLKYFSIFMSSVYVYIYIQYVYVYIYVYIYLPGTQVTKTRFI